MSLILHPDERLSTKAEPVTNFQLVPALAARMHAEMRNCNGIGLSANQFEMSFHAADVAPSVGIPQIIVIGLGTTYVHPTWLPVGQDTEVATEGCLSLPGILLPVRRFKAITLTALTTGGGEIEVNFYGIWARVIQHECDHLLGRLISDTVIL